MNVYGSDIPSDIVDIHAEGNLTFGDLEGNKTRINTRDSDRIMRRYLNRNEGALSNKAVSMWRAQAAELSQGYIRQMINNAEIYDEIINSWKADYSNLVLGVIAPKWEEAIVTAGDKIAEEISNTFAKSAQRIFAYSQVGRRMAEWIQNRSGELISDFTETQIRALRFILKQYVVDNPTPPRELSAIIRNTIGLTETQAQALAKFRNEISGEGLAADIVERQVERYAGFLHKKRADVIARTELSYAWNFGQYDAILEGRDRGYINGKVVKEWITAYDERTCPFCGAMDGLIIDLEGTFPTASGTTAYVPPAHQQCRCTVGYVVLD